MNETQILHAGRRISLQEGTLELRDAPLAHPDPGAYPVVTVGFAYGLLHERPTALQWVGIVLVLGGMVVTTASS